MKSRTKRILSVTFPCEQAIKCGTSPKTERQDFALSARVGVFQGSNGRTPEITVEQND